MNILSFLKNVEPDFKGRYLNDIWNFSNYEIENIHDFIQLVFPLNKPSESVFHGHFLKSKQDVDIIKNDKVAQLNLIKSSKWFLNFLELNNNWQNKYDHNQLRISRIIQSLRLLVSNEEADKFYKIILGMLKVNNQINCKTLEFWRHS